MKSRTNRIKQAGVSVLFVGLLLLFYACRTSETSDVYRIRPFASPFTPDCDWDKPEWKDACVFTLKHTMGGEPENLPEVQGRIGYDTDNLYLIWKVTEPYVRSTVTETNGPIWEDSCVEIFFAPDEAQPLRYFNLEINAGGTALMRYNEIPRERFVKLAVEEVQRIEIAHSLPAVVDPAIEEPVTWYIECRIPFEVLEKYAPVTRPAPGIRWKANMYKTAAENGSNPHWLTWAEIESEKPDFHLPGSFGTLLFE